MTLQLSEANYHGAEANKAFMSASQFKDFWRCSALALAKIRGEWEQEDTTALLVGGYVDAHFSGMLDAFKAAHPDILKRDGTLKADFVQADEIIQRIERDAVMMEHLTGEKQQILTGKIAGVRFKIKPDFLHPERIVDLKIMRDFAPIWTDEGKLPFVEAWGYDLQGAIYQEIIRQKIKKRLPFFLACATKEKQPDIGLFRIPQGRLDYCLDIVKRHCPEYSEIKLGIQEPWRCEKCDYCKATKVLKGPVDYDSI